MYNAALITKEFFVRGVRSMSLEEKWSLALKVLVVVGGVLITIGVTAISFCMISIHNLSVDIAKIPTENPPAWFAREVSDLKAQMAIVTSDIAQIKSDLRNKKDRADR